MVNVLDAMRRQKQAAESKPNGNGFTFFKIADKQRAVIRPLSKLASSDLVMFHHYWDQTGGRYVDAICTGSCQICKTRQLADNKRTKADLESKETFMLPIWLYGVWTVKLDPRTQTPELDESMNPQWERVTYENKTTNEVVVVGNEFRIMTLRFRSAWKSIAELFLKMEDEDKEDITARNFMIERQGGDTTTKYIPSKLKPSAFSIDIGDAPTTFEALHAFVLNAAPPVLVDGAPAPTKPSAPVQVEATDEDVYF
jgi:hypothetical protein